METKFVEITNAKIAYTVYGSGEPLVMCTGFATNMDLWSTAVIGQLQQKYRVIVFDYRGMGYSTNSAASVTMQSLADDLDEFLTTLGIGRAHILGWSMGGYVAQMFAINHPEKVNKLVLYATNCGDTVTLDPAPETIAILSDPSSTPMAMLGTLFPDSWLATHPEPWKFLPEAREPSNFDAIGMQYMAVQQWLTPGGGSAGLLDKLTMPVLVICGDQDKVVPAANADLLSAAISHCTVIIEPGCGHGFMYQLPEIFANHVLSFLK
ncbi:MAG: alpha/beta fold hydrolase [Bacteroidales bacterium]